MLPSFRDHAMVIAAGVPNPIVEIKLFNYSDLKIESVL
jgi:hypothetical protein